MATKEIKIGGYTVKVNDMSGKPDAIFKYEVEVYGADPEVLLGYDTDDSQTVAVMTALREAKVSEDDINASLELFV